MRVGIEGLEFHAYHGVHPQERVLGGRYTVHIQVDLTDAAASQAVASDAVAHTVDYGELYRLAAEVMAVPRNLIETVAHDLAVAVLQHSALVAQVHVRLEKHAPPIGAPSRLAFAEVRLRRSNLAGTAESVTVAN